jgi:hypothetical protein
MTTTYTVSGSAINAHSCIGCANTGIGSTYHVTGYAINTHSCIGCPLTLEIAPNATVDRRVSTDLVYSVWGPDGELTLDDATVVFAISMGGSGPFFITSTEDYSVITFDNTLVVHLPLLLNKGDDRVCTYTATITTEDDVYTMSGTLLFYGDVPPPPPAKESRFTVIIASVR